jgi:hypothetical protein
MMKDLQRLLRLDWDEIGHTLLQSAAEQMAETAHLRANQTPEVIAIEAIAAGHIRLSVRSPDLMRREQGDSKTAPQAFLAPGGQERAAIRDSLIAQLRKTIA